MSELRMFLAFFFMGAGAVFTLVSVIGVFRFKFVLNRMHSSALADTCGLLFFITGLIILSGFNFTSIKLLIIVPLFWLTTPVSGHLLSNLVKNTMSEEVEKNTVQKELENKNDEG